MHHSFALAAGAGTAQSPGRGQLAGASTQDLLEEALAARAAIKFSGKSGAPIMSGITADAATAEKVTYGLIRGCFRVVDQLPPALFDPHTAVRPCGVLDTYEAVCLLISEVVGWPQIRGPRAQKFGLKALKLNNAIAGEQGKARKAARRKGGDAEAAAADVLRLPVKLTLPPEQEAAVADAAPAAAPAAAPPAVSTAPPPPPMHEYTEDIAPPPPLLSPDTMPVQALAPAAPPCVPPSLAQPPVPAPAVTAVPRKPLRLQGSVLAEDAVLAARGCELAQTWLREGVDEPLGVQEGWDEFDAEARERHQDHRWDTYLNSLIAVKERFPMKVCCHYFEIGGCTHGIPCECGGTQAPWPWIIHHPTASRFCECHLSLRRDWVRYGIDGPTSSEELIAHIKKVEASRFRPLCRKEGYSGRGCTCNVCYESD